MPKFGSSIGTSFKRRDHSRQLLSGRGMCAGLEAELPYLISWRRQLLSNGSQLLCWRALAHKLEAATNLFRGPRPMILRLSRTAWSIVAGRTSANHEGVIVSV